ncbi:MAG: oligosaccharide flippase family protein, partial [Planctomycetes bacterium]|nr:oligosaccharide flippase family protein [Planctomycetota bacterium]
LPRWTLRMKASIGGKRIMRGGSVLAVGQIAGQVCSFARYSIVAHHISTTDFGIASMLVATIATLDMLSNLSLDKMVVQSPNGDDEAFLSTAHLVQAVRGSFSALILFLLAGPLTRLLSIPHAQGAFQVLALIPFLRGMWHLDLYRLQREMRFRTMVVADLISQLAVLLMSWPVAGFFGNHWAMLWLIFSQNLIYLLLSHLLAERRYKWSRNREFARQMFHFGWPLLLNGFLIAGAMQGDRYILGSAKRIFGSSAYTMIEVGIYSVALSIALMPTVSLVKVCGQLVLPLLSRHQGEPEPFERYTKNSFLLVSLIAAFCASFFIVAGEYTVVLLFTEKYRLAGKLLGWLGLMQSLRILRIIPTCAAIALGDTMNALIANCFRSVALLLIGVAVYMSMDLHIIAACGVLGEALAIGAVLVRLHGRHHLKLGHFIKALSVFALCIFVASLFESEDLGLIGCLWRTMAAFISCLGIQLLFFPRSTRGNAGRNDRGRRR